MKSIDERVLSDYNNGVELNRLRTDSGLNATELKNEREKAGFSNNEIHGAVGGAWLAPNSVRV